jgi:hypothetical protein
VRARCPHLDALASHVTEFAKILTGRRGPQLDAWIAKASAGDQPDLRSFITGLKRDYRAVLNGLTLPYSSGKVEGNVNRTRCSNGKCTAETYVALLRAISGCSGPSPRSPRCLAMADLVSRSGGPLTWPPVIPGQGTDRPRAHASPIAPYQQ